MTNQKLETESHQGRPIQFSIDENGQLGIEFDDYVCTYRYMSEAKARELRDWLNRVLPDEPPARRPCHFKAFGLWPCSLEEGHEGSHTIPANQEAEPKAEPGPWHALTCACIASVRRGLPMNEAGCDCGALNRGAPHG
jgi:hypothetical protein